MTVTRVPPSMRAKVTSFWTSSAELAHPSRTPAVRTAPTSAPSAPPRPTWALPAAATTMGIPGWTAKQGIVDEPAAH
ncbi:hypothetical protein [Jidongwangia harbinensis]|uniref:hypothetical protein n=1 Tax=Jidongwangia harbinensis TaxID=2878561 RepID=UPI001CD92577|nr:hypothetical protein [Jidongwangia harbinensis]MCA2217509.1 hypothetical protein [Jidongwangia harbinensis]